MVRIQMGSFQQFLEKNSIFMKPILNTGGICDIRRFYIQDMKQNTVLFVRV